MSDNRINTKAKLIAYIREQLGEPVITVECTDMQISNIIDSVVQKFTEYSYGTLEASVLFELKGAKEYNLPDNITNIISLRTGMTSNLTDFHANYGDYVPNMWSDMYFKDSLTGDIIPNITAISSQSAILEKYFGTDLVFNFNPHRKILQVFDNFKGPAVLHYNYEYLADEHHDFVYNHEWIKAYAIAKTKLLWGSIVGKYSQNLIGGATVNYSDIKQDAQAEIERLDSELLDKWADPCSVYIV